MLIIGHRGAAGIAPENTVEAMRAGVESDVDILEFDVRLTRDGIPVVAHDARLLRTHRRLSAVSHLTYDELVEKTKERPVTKLETILDEFFGVVMLNIELKSRGSGEAVLKLLQKRYIKRVADWDKLFISSFKGMELMKLRRKSKHVNLALLHSDNPFIFVAYHRFVQLSAVGFHRLYLNRVALEIAKRAKLFIYVYTVDRAGAVPLLERQGVNGIVTNHPDRMRAALEQSERN